MASKKGKKLIDKLNYYFLYILGAILILLVVIQYFSLRYIRSMKKLRWNASDYLEVEGFENSNTEKDKYEAGYNNDYDPFDDDYCNLYNIVFNEKAIYKHDVNEIMKRVFTYKRLKSGGKGTKGGTVKDPREARVLDAGVGVGRHYNLLNKKIKNLIGVDRSKSMIKYAKIRNPGEDFIHGNLTDTALFNTDSYDCITCLTDTLYHNKPSEMKDIIKNFRLWLNDNGILCVHIWNREKLDPAPMNRSQYYKDKNGIKHAQTKYKNFVHDAFWLKGDSNEGVANVKLVEKVIFNNKDDLVNKHKKIEDRVKVHDMYIPKKKEIIKMITDNGFELIDISDYKKIKVDIYDLYFFKKV